MAKVYLSDIVVDRVTNLALPTQPSDAANKEYVDATVNEGIVTYMVSAQPSVTTELMRVPYASVRSITGIVDIQNSFTYGMSYQVMARKMGNDIIYNTNHVIGSDSGITVVFRLDGTDMVADVINTYASASVDVYLRLL